MRTNTRIFPRIFPRLFERDASLAGFGLVDSGALLVFHAAWADAAGVNQTLLTGTGPVTTDHAETIYALGSDGYYDAYAADDPVWQYDADGDYLVSQPEGGNLVLYSNSYAGTGWTPSGTGTITTDEVGIGGIPNSATEIFDTDSAGYYSITNSRVINDSSDPVTWRVAIKKDTNTTRFPEVEFRVTSGTTQYTRVGLNTETGAAVAIRGSAGITRFEVVSVGDWWHLYCEVINNGSGNISGRHVIHPALGTVIGVPDQTAVGFIIAGNSEMYDGLTIEQVKSIGPIFTTSAAATTAAFVNSYPADNHSNTEGPLYLEFEDTGDDVVLLEAGTDEFLRIEDGGSVDLVTDGGFASDLSNWTDVAAFWSWSSGEAYHASAATLKVLSQDMGALVNGTTYAVTFYMRIVSGTAYARFGTTNTASSQTQLISTSGVHTVFFTPSVGERWIGFSRGGTTAEFYVDNVSFAAVDSKYLKLTDGTNQLQAACAAGEHKAGVAFAEIRGDELMDADAYLTGVGAWSGYAANTVATLAGENGVRCNYVDSTNGMLLVFSNANDCTSDLIIGKTYDLNFEAKTDSGATNIELRTASGVMDSTSATASWQSHSLSWVCESVATDYIRVKSANGTEIKNIGLKEVTNKMNLNLDGVWVDRLGAEEVTNGDFDTDTDWSTTGEWSIANGVASVTNLTTPKYLYQNFVPVDTLDGKLCEFTVNVLSNTGVLNLYARGISLGSLSVGINTIIGTFGTASYGIGLRAVAGGMACVVDSVSVKEVIGNPQGYTDYDGTLGSGPILLGDDERNVKRWNETDIDKQEDIIDREMA